LLWDWSGSRPLSRKRKPEGVLMEGCSTCLDGCAAGKSYWLFRQLSFQVWKLQQPYSWQSGDTVLISKKKKEILFLCDIYKKERRYSGQIKKGYTQKKGQIKKEILFLLSVMNKLYGDVELVQMMDMFYLQLLLRRGSSASK
jgi:hypothetical protein